MGQNALSARIEYEAVDSTKINVVYYVTLSKNDSNFDLKNLKATLSCTSNGKSVDVVGLTLVKKQRAPVACLKTNNPWNYTFEKSIDLTDAYYQDVSSCCDLRLDMTANHRDASLTTIQNPGSNDLYVYMFFKNCGSLRNANSTISRSPTVLIACQNLPYYVGLGSFDIVEYDSISYALSDPLTEKNKSVSYVTGFHMDLPIKPYYPGSLKYPYTNPSTTPPIGFHLDRSTGDLIFTPIDTTQSTVAILVTEWRKNSSGQPTVIGSSLQEFSLVVTHCAGNNPPFIKGSLSHSICPNEQICFTITTEDKVKRPPPPLPAPDPDTVRIRWGRDIPGATFTILNSKALHQSGRFCWTPTISDVSNLPHTFTVTARDNFCPINATTTRAFSILVKPKPVGFIEITKLNKNQFFITYHDTNTTTHTGKSSFQILDEFGQSIFDPTTASFASTGSYVSTKDQDTLNLLRSKKYVLRSVITNGSSLCSTVFNDTLNFHTTGIGRIGLTPLRLYPNPASDRLTTSVFLEEVRIYTQLGQLILRVEDADTIDIYHLRPGLYYLRGSNTNHTYSGKFIKD